MIYDVVMFDLGGVALEVESDRLVHQVAQLINKTFEEVQRAIYDEELLLPFELGQIAPQSYFEGLKKRLRLTWSYEQFVRAWNGIFNENNDVTQLMPRLRKRHKLLALTNTNVLHLAHIKTSFPALAIFDHWVASCEVGIRKPEAEIYAFAAKQAGVRPQAAIYIDDRPELVEAGRSAGLKAIRYESGDQLIQEFRALGIEV
ncbi:MAG: HAD family phosphatase [Candidatus Omnitrophica bacterium]|nr:HAD family phosphatase [Candidatus Omnitrophota bacterium]